MPPSHAGGLPGASPAFSVKWRVARLEVITDGPLGGSRQQGWGYLLCCSLGVGLGGAGEERRKWALG